jgi:glycosyltransferase involved in cell wall biosynthesis
MKGVVVVTFRSPANEAVAKRCPGKVVLIPYPLPLGNQVYRLMIEQLFVPLLASWKGCERLIMFGNFPAVIWWRDQVVLVHNLHYISPPKYRGLGFAAEKNLFRVLTRISKAHYICQTETMARALESIGLKALRVRVPFPKWYKGRLRLEHKGTKRDPSATKLLFYPAFFYPEKNHHILVAAAPWFRKRKVKVALTLDENNFSKLVGDARDVFINLGTLSQEDVITVYKEADAVIFPSKAESFGYPLFEAMLLGKPVIAADRPYARELLGDCGFFFDPCSVASLVKALDAFLESKEANIEEYLKRYEERIQAIACSGEEFLNALCEAGKGII